MKISNNFEQNSPAWYQYRESGIGASDIPALMDKSPFNTRFLLWVEKTKTARQLPRHPRAIAAMERGKLMEAEARAAYEKHIGYAAPAANVEHPEYSYLRASLDGFVTETDTILEIKCPGKADHAIALRNKVPPKYMLQVQAQLLAAGKVKAHYWSYRDGVGKLVEVTADPAMQAEILAAVIDFWDLVQKKTPPRVDISEMESLLKALEEQFIGIQNTITIVKTLSNALIMETSRQ